LGAAKLQQTFRRGFLALQSCSRRSAGVFGRCKTAANMETGRNFFREFANEIRTGWNPSWSFAILLFRRGTLPDNRRDTFSVCRTLPAILQTTKNAAESFPSTGGKHSAGFGLFRTFYFKKYNNFYSLKQFLQWKILA
jgi:hypothetical protein